MGVAFGFWLFANCYLLIALTGHTTPAHVVTPYSPRVSLGTRLRASDFVVADTGPDIPDWGVQAAEPHLRGAYHGNPSTPHDQASISNRVLLLPALPSPHGTTLTPSDSAAGLEPETSQKAKASAGAEQCLFRPAYPSLIPRLALPVNANFVIISPCRFSNL